MGQRYGRKRQPIDRRSRLRRTDNEARAQLLRKYRHSLRSRGLLGQFLLVSANRRFTSDDKRYPVKTTVGGVEATLVHLEITKQGEWTFYRNEPSAFAMERPASWLPCVFSTKKNWVQAGFLDPE